MITADTRKKIYSALLFAACALPLAASANPSVDEHTRASISIRDLDISTSDGVEALNRRLHRAAVEVCGSSDFRDVGWSAAHQNRQCVDKAIAKARAKLHTGGSAV